ncbi:MAG: hypothetical protein AAGF79_03480 [Pseudomonadota bacterium]
MTKAVTFLLVLVINGHPVTHEMATLEACQNAGREAQEGLPEHRVHYKCVTVVK